VHDDANSNPDPHRHLHHPPFTLHINHSPFTIHHSPSTIHHSRRTPQLPASALFALPLHISPPLDSPGPAPQLRPSPVTLARLARATSQFPCDQAGANLPPTRRDR
jgi:hypothetical protein